MALWGLGIHQPKGDLGEKTAPKGFSETNFVFKFLKYSFHSPCSLILMWIHPLSLVSTQWLNHMKPALNHCPTPGKFPRKAKALE